jgi:hypothetical protein
MSWSQSPMTKTRLTHSCTPTLASRLNRSNGASDGMNSRALVLEGALGGGHPDEGTHVSAVTHLCWSWWSCHQPALANIVAQCGVVIGQRPLFDRERVVVFSQGPQPTIR